LKLTWFGGTTIRMHIGGAIIIIDPDQAPSRIDRSELVSGADQLIAGFGATLPPAHPATWRPRKPHRLLDDTGAPPEIIAASVGTGGILIDAAGEPPLLLLSNQAPELGRWADNAIIVLFGDGTTLTQLGLTLLAASPPRLVALAADEAAADIAFSALRDQLDGTGLVALQPGMALEV